MGCGSGGEWGEWGLQAEPVVDVFLVGFEDGGDLREGGVALPVEFVAHGEYPHVGDGFFEHGCFVESFFVECPLVYAAAVEVGGQVFGVLDEALGVALGELVGYVGVVG